MAILYYVELFGYRYAQRYNEDLDGLKDVPRGELQAEADGLPRATHLLSNRQSRNERFVHRTSTAEILLKVRMACVCRAHGRLTVNVCVCVCVSGAYKIAIYFTQMHRSGTNTTPVPQKWVQ